MNIPNAGAITVLLQDDVAALQVQHGNARLDALPVSAALTISVGDMMEVWSNRLVQGAGSPRAFALRRRAAVDHAFLQSSDYRIGAASLRPSSLQADLLG